MNWPLYGAFSAAEAACLSAAQALRAELRGGGVKVLNVFAGPLETEWFQSVPPPKLSPAALATATVDALRAGVEDCLCRRRRAGYPRAPGGAAEGPRTGTRRYERARRLRRRSGHAERFG